MGGLDAVTTADEVIQAVQATATVEEDAKNIELVKMLPGFRETQVAKIKISNGWARRLAEAGRIKVGIIRYQVRYEEEAPKCFKCWEPEHIRRDCAGKDRSLDCLNCGEKGHKAVECQKES